MRLEILVENEDPQIFPLTKQKILIGSQDSCDIILQTDGVSRKHLVLVIEGDKYFVIDQGSTNGSFINEERLVPGRQIEFTSFFPIRLGDKVLVSLLSDEEAHSTLSEYNSPSLKASGDEATRALSLKDLQAVKTESLVKKRHDTVMKKVSKEKVPVKKRSDKKQMIYVQIFCAVILIAAFTLNYLSVDEEPIATQPVFKSQKAVIVAPESRFVLVKKGDLTPFDKILEIQKITPCLNEFEKYLCDNLALNYVSVVQVGTMVHIFLDGNPSYVKARDSMPAPVAKEGETVATTLLDKYREDLIYTALLYFLKDDFPKELDLDKFKGLNLTFILEMDTVTNEKAFSVGSFVPETLKEMLLVMEPRHFDTASKYGADSLHFLKEYFIFSANKVQTVATPEDSQVEPDKKMAPDPTLQSL